MKDFLKKYDPKHYKHYLYIINKKIGEYQNVHKYIKSLGTQDILFWLKSLDIIEEKSISFFEQCTVLVTLVIRLFILELDIEDVQLTNKEIIKLIKRYRKALKIELSYRKDVIDTTPTYTLLKD